MLLMVLFGARRMPTPVVGTMVVTVALGVGNVVDNVHGQHITADFVDFIGQAFADEIFRVYARQHPDIHVIPTSADTEVRRMIQLVISADEAVQETTEEISIP